MALTPLEKTLLGNLLERKMDEGATGRQIIVSMVGATEAQWRAAARGHAEILLPELTHKRANGTAEVIELASQIAVLEAYLAA